MRRMLLDVVRIYVVYGVYRGEDSLKAQTRQNRDAGNQLRVTNNTFFPVNWKNFLRVEANKDGLFRLLANAIWEFQPPHGKQIISKYGHNVVSSSLSDLSDLYCNHEEAYTRLLFYDSRAFHHGFSKVI